MVLETVDDTVAEPVAITEIPTTTTATTTTTTTTSTTTTSTATPTTITTHRAPASERPAPTIVLVLDNSNNNSRPSLHRAGTCYSLSILLQAVTIVTKAKQQKMYVYV